MHLIMESFATLMLVTVLSKCIKPELFGVYYQRQYLTAQIWQLYLMMTMILSTIIHTSLLIVTLML